MPKPMYDKTWPAMSKNGQGHGGPKRGPPVAGVDGNWECTACGNVNFATRDACNLCQSPKPQYRATVSGGQPTWEQPMQKRGRPVAGVDGNWACGSCGNVNFAHRTSCNRCGMFKPEERRGGRPVAGVNGNWGCAGLSFQVSRFSGCHRLCLAEALYQPTSNFCLLLPTSSKLRNSL
jgi:hypothetical protein